MEDWYWATRERPELSWHPQAVDGDGHSSSDLPPAGDRGRSVSWKRVTLFFHELIAASRKRLWIASPYFVPDEGIVNALQAAALRGVDVRIMLPSYPDHFHVWLASFSSWSK